MTSSIVWFKRDLRVHDQAPLLRAAERGDVIPLYIIEPVYWQLPDTSQRQWQFIQDSLCELNTALEALGSKLIIRTGDAVEVLTQLQQETQFTHLFSHTETGNMWTYNRDKAVKKWCQKQQITWQEFRQFGVVRGPFQRGQRGKDAWAAQWAALMHEPQLPAPTALNTPPLSAQLEQLDTALKFSEPTLPHQQRGGRGIGLDLLDSFLHQRGACYQTDMSSPILGEEGCSRLSAHITYGTLSLREIYQTARSRQDDIKNLPHGHKGKWSGALRAFIGRLHWHCHFMQKLESEPTLEFNNPNPAFDALDRTQDEARLHAWLNGQTGYPYIDACMRFLQAKGWINFRARAMLMSFASYHLWLDWRLTAPALARLFVDYEPGIHYCQTHMQSGVTGINQIRIYNPIKQGKDFDADANFITEWVPELAVLPAELRHEPWELAPAEALMYGFELGRDYPAPIIDHATASKAAKDKIYALSRSPEARGYAKQVFEKHGSRKRQASRKASL